MNTLIQVRVSPPVDMQPVADTSPFVVPTPDPLLFFGGLAIIGIAIILLAINGRIKP